MENGMNDTVSLTGIIIEEISCSAGCKRTIPDIDKALAAGWENLPISRRWRCPQCYRELKTINERNTP